MVAPQPSQLPGPLTLWWCVRTGTNLRCHWLAGVVPESPCRALRQRLAGGGQKPVYAGRRDVVDQPPGRSAQHGAVLDFVKR